MKEANRKELDRLFHSSKTLKWRVGGGCCCNVLAYCMQSSPSHFTLRSSLKCCLKLSRIPDPSEGGQNKTPGNLVRVLGWHGPSFWGQVCLLSGPVEGNCFWLPARPSARQRRIIWTPVFSFPNCCTSKHQSCRHNIS